MYFGSNFVYYWTFVLRETTVDMYHAIVIFIHECICNITGVKKDMYKDVFRVPDKKHPENIFLKPLVTPNVKTEMTILLLTHKC